MKASFYPTVGFILLCSLLISCGNKMNFKRAPDNVSPVTEVPTNPPIGGEKPQMTSGACPVNARQQILSCLDCESTPPVPAPPILSRKGQDLWDIMTVACSISNKSDPTGYRPPTREQVLARLIQCSPTLYPDTAFESTQAKTIHALKTDRKAQENAFKNLYYNSASTDFETYFGLEISEARYTFCRGSSAIGSGGIYPIEYWNAWYEGQNYPLPPIWKRAQVIRNSLRNCMQKSLTHPDVNQPPATPGRNCRFESAQGDINSEILNQANKWINEGHEVMYEGLGQCGALDYPDSLLDSKGKIKIAIKICQ
ncbi:MAG: hypothetical protein ACK5V3_05015 [Bdellovibrionales bacterium]